GAFLARWRVHAPILRAMDALAEHDKELRAFWAGIGGRVVTEMAAGIDRERAEGRALPGPPSALDLAWALSHMYWRAGRQATLDPSSTPDDQCLVETLTTVSLRAIYGHD
ncbi:MAG: hypothetical protein ACRD1G_09195, partial [Acidimicrobiales bacterium]